VAASLVNSKEFFETSQMHFFSVILLASQMPTLGFQITESAWLHHEADPFHSLPSAEHLASTGSDGCS
jgi:hypothetical protein